MTLSATELLSQDDNASFLVPCLGFQDYESAEQYRRSPVYTGAFSNAAYGLVRTTYNSYVPLRNFSTEVYRTDVIDRYKIGFRGKPAWHTLRRINTPKPKGGYNVALLVGGKRQFYENRRFSQAGMPSWLSYIASQSSYDCYAAWSRVDGTPIGRPMQKAHGMRMYAVRSGRGVLYAKTPLFSFDGSAADYVITCVLVEFKILDRDPDKDDMLRAETSWVVCKCSQGGIQSGFAWSNLDDGWRSLIEATAEEYGLYCSPVPLKTAEWRDYILDQLRKEKADQQKPLSEWFRNVIGPLDWHEALRRVEEAWQLKLVIDQHCNSRFDRASNIFDSTASRFHRMVGQHDCTTERREQLHEMAKRYVSLMTPYWDHTGD